MGPVEIKRQKGGQGGGVGVGVGTAKGTCKLLLQPPFSKLPLSECLTYGVVSEVVLRNPSGKSAEILRAAVCRTKLPPKTF